MPEELKVVAEAIESAYSATVDNPEAHEAIDVLRQDLAKRLAAAGFCSYDQFSNAARTIR